VFPNKETATGNKSKAKQLLVNKARRELESRQWYINSKLIQTDKIKNK
jgi:hypothetical protein